MSGQPNLKMVQMPAWGTDAREDEWVEDYLDHLCAPLVGIVPLADCSVVVAPYQIEGEPAGTVGVLGPTRMRYDQALAAVAVVSQRLGKALNRGLST